MKECYGADEMERSWYAAGYRLKKYVCNEDGESVWAWVPK